MSLARGFVSPLLFVLVVIPSFAGAAEEAKDAEAATREANATVAKTLDFADREDFEDAKRGLIAPPSEGVIKGGVGQDVWNLQAYELRHGVPKIPTGETASADVVTAMTIPMFFEYLGVRLNGPKADGKKIILNWSFPDVHEQYVLNLENSALTYTPNQQAPKADASFTLSRATLDAINLRQTTFEKEIGAGHVKVQGDRRKLAELLSLLDSFEPAFNIVTP